MVVLRYRGRRVHPSANEVASKVWGRPRRASSPLPVYCLRKWPRRRACGGHCAHNWKRKASSVTRWETRRAQSISNVQELASREKPVGRFVDGDLCIYCVDGHRSSRWLGSWKSFQGNGYGPLMNSLMGIGGAEVGGLRCARQALAATVERS